MSPMRARRLGESFRYAFAGVAYAWRTQRNLRVHAAAAVVVLLLAWAVGATGGELALLVLTIGMVAALRLSQRLGMVTEDDVARGEALLQRLGLPVAAGPVDVEAVWQAMGRDKKVLDGRRRLVVREAIGRATVVDDVPDADARAALASVCR